MCRGLWTHYGNWLAPWFFQPTKLTASPASTQTSSPLSLTSTWQCRAYHSSTGWGARWLPKSPDQRHRPMTRCCILGQMAWNTSCCLLLWQSAGPLSVRAIREIWLEFAKTAFNKPSRRVRQSKGESKASHFGISESLVNCFRGLTCSVPQWQNHTVKAVHQDVGQSQSHRLERTFAVRVGRKGMWQESSYLQKKAGYRRRESLLLWRHSPSSTLGLSRWVLTVFPGWRACGSSHVR